MFAALAVLDFIIGAILRATQTDTGDFDLLYIGLALFALHFVWSVAVPYRRNHPPQ
jgi:hypothetical protein